MKALWIVLLTAAVVSGSTNAGAEEPKIHRLRGGEATSGKLIEVLKTRGVKPVAGAPQTPQCQQFQTRRTRGVNLAAAETSEIAAIDVRFAYNSAELTPEATRTLDELGKALTSAELGPSCFQIEGHTDSSGGDDYNQRLSERRAQSVVRYLNSNFSIDRERLVAVGYGKTKPIADNSTDEGRAENRRVQIANLGQGGDAEP